jgi:hypothetical protein
MPAVSVKQVLPFVSDTRNEQHLRLLIQAQYDALAATLASVSTAITTLTAKLDADVGVTDTNYAALINPSPTIAAVLATKIIA